MHSHWQLLSLQERGYLRHVAHSSSNTRCRCTGPCACCATPFCSAVLCCAACARARARACTRSADLIAPPGGTWGPDAGTKASGYTLTWTEQPDVDVKYTAAKGGTGYCKYTSEPKSPFEFETPACKVCPAARCGCLQPSVALLHAMVKQLLCLNNVAWLSNLHLHVACCPGMAHPSSDHTGVSPSFLTLLSSF
jgi:hypothetical protein